MFSTARWRLTIAFTVALALILGVSALTVYLVTRSLIYDQVDAELAAKAQSDAFLLEEDQGGRGPRPEPTPSPSEKQEFEQGGYFFAVTDENGEITEKSGNCEDESLVPADVLAEAAEEGEATTNTVSPEGDQQRVYVLPDSQGSEQQFLQMGRSIEPELSTLSRLRTILLAVVAFSAVPALTGGYVLSGRALRPIKQAMDSQKAFLADASHELRTPVAVVRTNAEILERHAGSGKLGTTEVDAAAVDDILSESERLGRMVGQMLTLAQADSGHAIVTQTDVNLGALAEEVVRSMQALAEAKGIVLGIKTDEDVLIQGDGERLREVLVTLIDNAIKYTPAGSRVDVSVSRSSKKAVVSVADTGIGIPQESLPHLFDRFYRVDEARSRDDGGTGLGLAIAREVIEAHNGTISVASEVGQGTTMTVQLRLLQHR